MATDHHSGTGSPEDPRDVEATFAEIVASDLGELYQTRAGRKFVRRTRNAPLPTPTSSRLARRTPSSSSSPTHRPDRTRPIASSRTWDLVSALPILLGTWRFAVTGSLAEALVVGVLSYAVILFLRATHPPENRSRLRDDRDPR